MGDLAKKLMGRYSSDAAKPETKPKQQPTNEARVSPDDDFIVATSGYVNLPKLGHVYLPAGSHASRKIFNLEELDVIRSTRGLRLLDWSDDPAEIAGRLHDAEYAERQEFEQKRSESRLAWAREQLQAAQQPEHHENPKETVEALKSPESEE